MHARWSLLIWVLLGMACLTLPSASQAAPQTTVYERVKAQLAASPISLKEINGVGFGVEPEVPRAQRPHPLNKIAQNLYRRFKTAIILTHLNQGPTEAFFHRGKNVIFVFVTPDNVKELIDWNDSSLQWFFLHEVRHLYLRKALDEQGRVSIFSGALSGKHPNQLTLQLNPYYSFLSFEEFSTFALQLVHQFRTLKAKPTQENLMQLVLLNLTLSRFSAETSDAVHFYLENLQTRAVTFGEHIEEFTPGILVRYLTLKSKNWDLDLIVDQNASTRKDATTTAIAQSRLEALRSRVVMITRWTRQLEPLLMSDGKLLEATKLELDKIEPLIERINHATRDAATPTQLRCEQVFWRY